MTLKLVVADFQRRTQPTTSDDDGETTAFHDQNTDRPKKIPMNVSVIENLEDFFLKKKKKKLDEIGEWKITHEILDLLLMARLAIFSAI